jgi:broad specificity phosphatase PhoE
MDRDAFSVLMSAGKPSVCGHKRSRESVADDCVIVIDDDAEDATPTISDADMNSWAAAPAKLECLHNDATKHFAPLFSTPRISKRLLLVRHCETQGYHLVDTPLSVRGRQQALEMHTALPCGFMDHVGAVVVSPLCRALQTLRLGFQHVWDFDARYYMGAPADDKELPSREVAANTAKLVDAVASSAHAANTKRKMPTYICPVARERLLTRGDVGSEREKLMGSSDLHPFKDALAGLPSGWWNTRSRSNPSRVPSATARPTFATLPFGESSEDMAAFSARVRELREYLRSLPFDSILVLAHANLIAELSGERRRLGYGEFTQMHVRY